MPDDHRDLVRTGIAGLDSILGGGIPRGNTILVKGAVGTGKTTLGLEYIYQGATKFNEPGMVVLFEVSPGKVMRDAANLGWDFEELERQGRVKILFTTPEVFQQELQQADQPQVPGAARQVVHLPGNGDHHHLRGGAGQDATDPQPQELALGEQAPELVVQECTVGGKGQGMAG